MKIESFNESSNHGEEGEVEVSAGRIVDMCETQWTIRHSSYESINENYSWLCALMDYSLNVEKGMQQELRARILGCSKQFSMFEYLFGVYIGINIYSMAEGLSVALQEKKVSVLNGVHLSRRVLKTLQCEHV